MEKEKKNRTTMPEWLFAIILAIVILAIGFFSWRYWENILPSILCSFIFVVYISGLFAKHFAWWKEVNDSAVTPMKRISRIFVYAKIFVISCMTILLPAVLLASLLSYVLIFKLGIPNASFIIFISISMTSILSLFPWYGRFIMNICFIKIPLEQIFNASCEYNAANIKYFMYVYYLILMVVYSIKGYWNSSSWMPNEIFSAFLLYFAAADVVSRKVSILNYQSKTRENEENLKEN